MRYKLLSLLFISASFLFAQDLPTETNNNTKFQVGVHYLGNLRNNNIISDGFNGVVGISGNYAFYQNDNLAFSAGLTLDYLQTRDVFLQNDILIWNPNISVEANLFNGKLTPFFGIGYAFFSNKFQYVSGVLDPFDPALMAREKKLNFNGITINPGVKYHLSELLFLEGSYKYYPVNSSDMDGTANVHLINLGIGFKF
ncbi:outer membrane protein [Flavobacterium psychraquaticum]|uniref:outer membrane protein n=1 Tax=Flavobacterium psychraquaticum TaxID=3103958 RepID=UPI002ACDF68F|nr:outer membrane beta-barrel protein [Flavobacterium sp. LB-N7T]